MNFPRFNVINSGFTCENCGKVVPPAKATCRNHCPFCLTSKHVDENPGDRANDCGGLMDLTGYETSQSHELTLLFTCRVCSAQTRNRSTAVGDPSPDTLDVILAKGTMRPPTRS